MIFTVVAENTYMFNYEYNLRKCVTGGSYTELGPTHTWPGIPYWVGNYTHVTGGSYTELRPTHTCDRVFLYWVETTHAGATGRSYT